MLCCPVVERRQYTLHLGTRETLIDLFERQFIESHEVRDGEHVVVLFTGFASQVAYAQYLATLSHAYRWHGAVAGERAQHRTGTPEVVRLTPLHMGGDG